MAPVATEELEELSEELDDIAATQVSHNMADSDYFFARQPTVTRAVNAESSGARHPMMHRVSRWRQFQYGDLLDCRAVTI
jgi:hypothetical protein